MKKEFVVFMALFLIFGMLVHAPLVLAQEDDNSGPGNADDTTTEDDSDDDDSDDDSSGSSDDELEIEIESEDDSDDDSDDSEERVRFRDREDRVEIEIERNGQKIKIRADGAAAERLRAALQDRNRIRIHTNDSTLPENCSRRGSTIRCELENGRSMVVEAGESGNTIVSVRGVNMTTRVELYHHDGRVFGVFGENESRPIDFLPDEIRERVRARINASIEGNESIELNDEGEYRVEVRKRARFLGLFRIRERMIFEVDPTTGGVLSERAPWWGFLAADETSEDTEDEAEESQITITLSEQSDSGESGTAVLVESNGEVTVTLSTVGFEEDVSQPAHIHLGSCPDVGAIAYPLTNVLNGESVTVLDVTFDQLGSELPLGINVHKSAEEASIWTACGDIEF
jgi:hypothetical protein